MFISLSKIIIALGFIREKRLKPHQQNPPYRNNSSEHKKPNFSRDGPMEIKKIIHFKNSTLGARDKAIIDVLLRLPAKSLMRFKAVSKSWHALICDPFFTESHHIIALERPDASFLLFYLLKRNLHTRAIFPTDFHAVCSTLLPVNILGKSMPCTKVVNGLICLSDDFDKNQVYVLNVTTGEHIDLPRNRMFSKGKGILGDESDEFVDFKASYFLGFDPLPKEYKLLNFQNVKREKKNEKHYVLDRCFILAFGKDEAWREIDGPNFQLGGETETETETVSLNGKIYWNRTLSDRSGGSWMPFFDLQQEKFHALRLPYTGGRSINSITQIGGNVTIMCEDRTLYKLEDHESDDWGDWTRANFQPLIGSELNSFHWDLIGGTNTDEIMVVTLSKPENVPVKLLMRYGQHKMHKTVMFLGLETRKYRVARISLPGLPEEASDNLVVFADAAASNHVENIVCLKALFGRTGVEDQRSCLNRKRVADSITLSQFTYTIMYNGNGNRSPA